MTISPDPGGVSNYTAVGTNGQPVSGSPGLIADNLVNNTDNIQTITYRFEVSASGFTSSSIQTAVVNVNPAPTMTITNTNLVINSGGMTDILY
ncbi:MAG: hypothetical protein U5K79_22480 [Cyclobacteriaceae bacterium]|nr:hypothetical protein [Cyclobacteriaceae bacterium]